MWIIVTSSPNNHIGNFSVNHYFNFRCVFWMLVCDWLIFLPLTVPPLWLVCFCRSGRLQRSWRCLIMGRSRTSPQLRPWGTPAPWLAPATKTPPPSITAPSPSHQTPRTRRRKTARSDSSWPEEAIRVSAEITVGQTMRGASSPSL